MAWSESVDPNYPEIRMETYKSDDPTYKHCNRTHYYDIPTRNILVVSMKETVRKKNSKNYLTGKRRLLK
jgi:hypothetical protein